MTESSNKDENKEPTLNDEWMIRPCSVYDEEYKDCTSFKGRFHQYFVFGQYADCSPWKRDYGNCCRWQERKDLRSGNELVQSEKARRRQRLEPHYNNGVWRKRKSPPENWAAPLPEHVQKEYEATYLNIKSKEMRGEAPPTIDPSYCALM